MAMDDGPDSVDMKEPMDMGLAGPTLKRLFLQLDKWELK